MFWKKSIIQKEKKKRNKRKDFTTPVTRKEGKLTRSRDAIKT